jgi:probable rRNA maturation factor
MDNFEESEEEIYDGEENEDPIVFHSEEIEFELKNQEQIAAWIKESAEAEGKALSTINFIFCSDEYLLQMNLEYLQHDTYTDVITFPYAEKEDDFIEGDIFISVERTAENAAKFGVTPEQELHRVMIHGVLHLIGYEDKTAAKKKRMTEKEDEYLSKLKLS